MSRYLRIVCVLVVGFACVLHAAAGTSDEEVIKVDWSPLLTDNVGWNITSGGWAVGLVDAVSGGDVDVNMGGSWQLSWLNVIGAKYNNGHGQRFTVGVGIDWRNYKLNKGKHYTANGDKMGVAADGGEAQSKSSRLKVFSIEVPVTVRQRVLRHCDVFAGVVTNFNVRASMENVWMQDGNKSVETRTSGLHQNVVTADLLAGVKWRGVGYYVRYSPFDVISSKHGPKFQTLSMGLVLAL